MNHQNCPPDCSHVTFHYCGAVGTHCDRHCTCTCRPCVEERARLGSIGPYFYALSPITQAHRIMRFAEAIWEHNETISLASFAKAIREALRSMGPFSGVVRARPQFVLIEGPGYVVSSAPEGTFIVENGI